MNVTNTLEILYNLKVDTEMIRAFNSVNKFILHSTWMHPLYPDYAKKTLGQVSF